MIEKVIENPVAQRLQQLLDERGWTRKDLERRSGVDYHTLYNLWRRPMQDLTAANAEKMAAALGTTSRFILFGDAPPPDDRRAALLALYDEADEATRREMEDYARFLAERRHRNGK